MATDSIIYPNRTRVRLNLIAHWCLIPVLLAIAYWSRSVVLLLVLVLVAPRLIDKLLPSPRSAGKMRLRSTLAQRQQIAWLACVGGVSFLIISLQWPDIGAQIGQVIQWVAIVLAIALVMSSIRNQIRWWRFGIEEDITHAPDTPKGSTRPSA